MYIANPRQADDPVFSLMPIKESERMPEGRRALPAHDLEM